MPGILTGGEKRKSEKNRLRRGVNILISTPGRLVDHIKTTERLLLRNVRHYVLDEADRMLEMGYEKNVAEITKAITDAKRIVDSDPSALAPLSLQSFSLDSNKSSNNEQEDGEEEESSDDEEVAMEDIDDVDENGDVVGGDEKSPKDESEETSKSTDAKSIIENRLKVIKDETPACTHQTVMLSATLTHKVQKLAGKDFSKLNAVVC